MPIISIVLSVFLAAVFILVLLPSKDAPISYNGKYFSTRLTLALGLVILALGVVIFKSGILGLLYMILALFCLWAFIFGFLVDSRYFYYMALIFLIFCPLILLSGIYRLVEVTAIIAFLCLLMGVFHDVFYEKLINK